MLKLEECIHRDISVFAKRILGLCRVSQAPLSITFLIKSWEETGISKLIFRSRSSIHDSQYSALLYKAFSRNFLPLLAAEGPEQLQYEAYTEGLVLNLICIASIYFLYHLLESSDSSAAEKGPVRMSGESYALAVSTLREAQRLLSSAHSDQIDASFLCVSRGLEAFASAVQEMFAWLCDNEAVVLTSPTSSPSNMNTAVATVSFPQLYNAGPLLRELFNGSEEYAMDRARPGYGGEEEEEGPAPLTLQDHSSEELNTLQRIFQRPLYKRQQRLMELQEKQRQRLERLMQRLQTMRVDKKGGRKPPSLSSSNAVSMRAKESGKESWREGLSERRVVGIHSAGQGGEGEGRAGGGGGAGQRVVARGGAAGGWTEDIEGEYEYVDFDLQDFNVFQSSTTSRMEVNRVRVEGGEEGPEREDDVEHLQINAGLGPNLDDAEEWVRSLEERVDQVLHPNPVSGNCQEGEEGEEYGEDALSDLLDLEKQIQSILSNDARELSSVTSKQASRTRDVQSSSRRQRAGKNNAQVQRTRKRAASPAERPAVRKPGRKRKTGSDGNNVGNDLNIAAMIGQLESTASHILNGFS